MSQNFRLSYIDNQGVKRSEVHDVEAQSVAYALAYESDGYTILSIVNLATGIKVDYTGIPYEEIECGRIGKVEDKEDCSCLTAAKGNDRTRKPREALFVFARVDLQDFENIPLRFRMPTNVDS